MEFLKLLWVTRWNFLKMWFLVTVAWMCFDSRFEDHFWWMLRVTLAICLLIVAIAAALVQDKINREEREKNP